jgi:hypothetical protein
MRVMGIDNKDPLTSRSKNGIKTDDELVRSSMVNKKPKVKVGKAIPNGLDEGSMRMGSVDEDSSEYDDEDSTNKEATGQKKDGEDARISFKLPHMKKDAKA